MNTFENIMENDVEAQASWPLPSRSKQFNIPGFTSVYKNGLQWKFNDQGHMFRYLK